jgi:hypothetical protein
MNTFTCVLEIEMKKFTTLLFVFFVLSAAKVFADPPLNVDGYIDGESIRFDPQSGNYIVTYYGDSPQGDRLITLVYDTPNKIKPGVRAQLRATSGRDIAYSYEFSNDKAAKQDIYALGFTVRAPWWENASLVTHATAASQASAGNMAGTAQAIESRLSYTDSVEAARMQQPDKWLPEVSFAKTNLAFRFSWQAHPNRPVLDDIKPGQARRGFGLLLPYLPGLVKFGFEGNSKSFGFPGAAGGDSKIWKDLDKLMFGNTAPAPSVQSLGPKVLIPEPFSAKELAAGISNDLASWVEAGQLSEPLAQRLRLSLAAMGSAAELNNASGVLGNAERTFFELFSRCKGMGYQDVEAESDVAKQRPDHPELSRLAARAIAFNTFELTRRYFVSALRKDK